MKNKLLTIVLTFFLSSICNANELSGLWKGVLNLGQQQLNLIAEFSDDNGNITGKFYSVDQSKQGIPMTIVTRKGDKLNFEISHLKIKYTGNLSGNKIKGDFQQNGIEWPLSFTKEKVAKKIEATTTPDEFEIANDALSTLLGEWNGTLKVDEKNSLKLNLIFEKTQNGKCKAFLISPQQSSSKIPLSAFEVNKSKIKISISSLGLTLDGDIRCNKISAKFKQGALKQKIIFTKDN